MTSYNSTFEWLKDLIIINDESDENIIIRNGRVLTHIGGFSQDDYVFSIYKDDYNYCAHSGNEWLEIEPPMFGYFDINLSWDVLLKQIANKYDFMKNSITK